MVLRAATLLILFAPSFSFGQWTVTDLNPSDARLSNEYGADGTHQAGRYVDQNFTSRAVLWNGSANQFTDLSPTGSVDSSVGSSNSGIQGGYVRTASGNPLHAALWNGSADSFVDLAPNNLGDSWVSGVSASDQAGLATVGGKQHPGLWHFSAGSFVDLMPDLAGTGRANATDGSQQVGNIFIQNGPEVASLWTGSKESWVNLDPGTNSSAAYAVSHGHQGGSIGTGFSFHAALWSGTAASVQDLNPTGSTASIIYAMSKDFQAGWSGTATAERATLWSGSAQSAIDLGALVSADFVNSQVNALFQDGDMVVAVGEGQLSNGRTHALLWTGIVPENNGMVTCLSGLSLLAIAGARRMRNCRSSVA